MGKTGIPHTSSCLSPVNYFVKSVGGFKIRCMTSATPHLRGYLLSHRALPLSLTSSHFSSRYRQDALERMLSKHQDGVPQTVIPGLTGLDVG